MDQFAVDLQRGTGVNRMGSFDLSLPDRRTGDPLVETRECNPVESRPHQGCHADFGEIVSH